MLFVSIKLLRIRITICLLELSNTLIVISGILLVLLACIYLINLMLELNL